MTATRIDATPAEDAAEPIRAELIEELRERARKAEERERAERDRAERYERELAELRRANADLVTRLLPPAPDLHRGFFRRMFGK
jgi:hypothetical protein